MIKRVDVRAGATTYVLLALLAMPALAPAGRDPHRPACTTDSCKAIKRYLKSHYCGESDIGNGPADGCDIRIPKRQKLNATTLADYSCHWNEQKQKSECKQVGEIPAAVSQSFREEFRRLGMPASTDKHALYRILSSNGLSVAEAYYGRLIGTNLWLCQVVAVFTQPSLLRVIHEVRYQRTDADVPRVTTWLPIDFADVNGDGQVELVLEGDAYEDHWLEVLMVKPDLSTKLLFSGLGYYL